MSIESSDGIPPAPPLTPVDEFAQRLAKQKWTEKEKIRQLERLHLKEKLKSEAEPLHRHNVVMLMGGDSVLGPEFDSFNQAIDQNVEHIIASVEIAQLVFTTPLNKKDLEKAEPGVKSMIRTNRLNLFRSYDVRIHPSGTYLILTRKGGSVKPDCNFDQITSLEQLKKLPTLQEQVRSQDLLEAFPDKNENMTIFAAGHGGEDATGTTRIAGLPPKIFQEVFSSLSKRGHEDLVVVTSCQSGSKKAAQHFPKARPFNSPPSKTTYIVTSIDSLTVAQEKPYDYNRFFKKAEEVLEEGGKQLKDYVKIVNQVGGDEEFQNQSQIRFPFGPFQVIRDINETFNLTHNRIRQYQIENPSNTKNYVIPENAKALTFEENIDFPIELSTAGKKTFIIYSSESNAISKLILSGWCTLTPIINGIREISYDGNPGIPKKVQIRKLMVGGKTLTSCDIYMPDVTEKTSKPHLAFRDEDRNIVNIIPTEDSIDILIRAPEGTQYSKSEEAAIEKWYHRIVPSLNLFKNVNIKFVYKLPDK